MSRTRKRHARPTKYNRLTEAIQWQEDERRHFLETCKTTKDPEVKRVCWIRAQEAASLILKYRAQLRKITHRLPPAEKTPLFNYNSKEI